MRGMTDSFNKDECILNLKKVLGIEELDELPHYNTVNDFLSMVETSELEAIRTYMIKELFKKRCFDDYRIDGKYWGIIFDGTGLFTNSHNYNAMKNHYILTQLADIFMQLFENGLKVLKLLKKTAKEMSLNLLEAIRIRTLTDKDILQLAKPIQVRFG